VLNAGSVIARMGWLRDLHTCDPASLVPTWTQLPDGRVEWDICLGCFGLMEDPIGTVEVCEGASGVVH
jgi:hypothetical protein